ncbi:MAG: biotin--[acetyl-CoA-carboxylase] ligase [Syntrophales bacterium]|nr:biotin--[acetyl-CoA-carboxylase] ligase [Syntrophales bacterium]
MRPFDGPNLTKVLRATPFPYVHFYKSIDSTNLEAYRLALEGAPEGTVVIAEEQTKGRGRVSHSWQSPPKGNFYGSFLLRPDMPPKDAPLLTLVAGVAVAELLSSFCAAEIKWPNDIIVKGKKICGILTEGKTTASKVEFVIIGIGINVNMVYADMPEELKSKATSLIIETGQVIDLLKLTEGLANGLGKWYKVFILQGFGCIKEQWEKYAKRSGRIRATYGQETLSGNILGIDNEGCLMIQDDTGKVHKITSGDIFFE